MEIKIENKKVFYTAKKTGLAGYINMDVKRYIKNTQNLLKNLHEYVSVKDNVLSVNMEVISKLETLKKQTKSDERKAVSNLLTALKNVTGINKPVTASRVYNHTYTL